MTINEGDPRSHRPASGLLLLIGAAVQGFGALVLAGDPFAVVEMFGAAAFAWAAVSLFAGRCSRPRALALIVAIPGAGLAFLMFGLIMLGDPAPDVKAPSPMFALIVSALVLAITLTCAWRVWTLPMARGNESRRSVAR